jgi:hypothetical protein
MSETISPIPARTLHQVCEDARRAACPVCPALPGDDCVFTTVPVSVPGYHVGRLAVAETAGVISAADFDVAVVTAGAFTVSTVIYDDEGKGKMPKPLGPFETEREARAAPQGRSYLVHRARWRRQQAPRMPPCAR